MGSGWRWLPSVVLALLAALLSAACLDDLPDAATCPAPAKLPSKSCGSNPNPQVCTREDDLAACFGRASCACATPAVECPTRPGACYPAGDCPEAVRRAVPGAVCHLPADGDLVLPPSGGPDNCSCGCLDCVYACDGTGPVFGLKPLDPPPRLLLALNVARYTPSHGRFGAYVRLRGTPQLSIEVSRGPAGTLARYDVSSSNPEQFTEHVLFDQPGDAAYAWTAANTAPEELRFSAVPTKETHVEIDCVIPFIVQ